MNDTVGEMTSEALSSWYAENSVLASLARLKPTMPQILRHT